MLPLPAAPEMPRGRSAPPFGRRSPSGRAPRPAPQSWASALSGLRIPASPLLPRSVQCGNQSPLWAGPGSGLQGAAPRNPNSLDAFVSARPSLRGGSRLFEWRLAGGNSRRASTVGGARGHLTLAGGAAQGDPARGGGGGTERKGAGRAARTAAARPTACRTALSPSAGHCVSHRTTDKNTGACSLQGRSPLNTPQTTRELLGAPASTPWGGRGGQPWVSERPGVGQVVESPAAEDPTLWRPRASPTRAVTRRRASGFRQE